MLWALLVNLWALGSAAFRTLVGANTESRADFVAITDALQTEMARLGSQIATEIDRRERMQAKLDAMEGVVEQLRRENTDLRRQLAGEEAKNRTLTDRVAYLESKESARKPLEGMGS